MTAAWSVVEDGAVAEGAVTIAPNVWSGVGVDVGDTVKVRANGRTRYLRASQREGATGTELHVRPGTFPGAGAGTGAGTVELEKVSKAKLRTGLIFKTGNGIRSLLGVVLAVAATVTQALDATIASPNVPLIAITAALQVVGLLLVFFQSVWKLSGS